MSSDVEGTNPLTAESIILGLAAYFPSVNLLSKQKRAMRCGMRKPHVIKVRRYAARLIDLNEYLDLLPRANLTDKFGMTKLNNILLKSIINSWNKQEYVQVFDFESIT